MLSTTIVIPVYNGARFLADALNSIQSQTCRPTEVILVDDCSSDASRAAISQWTTQSSPQFSLVTLSTERNSGSPARPLNVGIAAAKGELIAVLEQDDVFLQPKLERCLATFQKHPELEFLTHGAERYKRAGEFGSIAQQNFERDPQVRAALTKDGSEFCMDSTTATLMAVKHSMFATGFPGIVFRKSAWEKASQLPKEYKIATDYAFLLAVSRCGSGCYLPQRLYARRSHSACLSHNSSLSFLEVLRILTAQIESEPQILEIPGLTEAITWRTIESAWNLAAFGFMRQSRQIILAAMRVRGWSMRRELQRQAVWLMPAYRKFFMPNAVSNEETANAIVDMAEILLKLTSD